MCVFCLVCVRVCGRTGSALALLYGTSATLEHHHFNHAVMILQSKVCDVLISAAVQLLFTFFQCLTSYVVAAVQHFLKKCDYKHRWQPSLRPLSLLETKYFWNRNSNKWPIQQKNWTLHHLLDSCCFFRLHSFYIVAKQVYTGIYCICTLHIQ